jgi:hypothetical protein
MTSHWLVSRLIVAHQLLLGGPLGGGAHDDARRRRATFSSRIFLSRLRSVSASLREIPDS